MQVLGGARDGDIVFEDTHRIEDPVPNTKQAGWFAVYTRGVLETGREVLQFCGYYRRGASMSNVLKAVAVG